MKIKDIGELGHLTTTQSRHLKQGIEFMRSRGENSLEFKSTKITYKLSSTDIQNEYAVIISYWETGWSKKEYKQYHHRIRVID